MQLRLICYKHGKSECIPEIFELLNQPNIQEALERAKEKISAYYIVEIDVEISKWVDGQMVRWRF